MTGPALMGRAISPTVSLFAPLNSDKILPTELNLLSGTCIYLKAGSCNKATALLGSTSTLCTSKLLMHKLRTSASWCGVITLDELMGGNDMGPSTCCIASLLFGVLMIFTLARIVAARSSFFLLTTGLVLVVGRAS